MASYLSAFLFASYLPFLLPYLLSLLCHRPGIRVMGETELAFWLDPTSIIKFGNLGGEGRGGGDNLGWQQGEWEAFARHKNERQCWEEVWDIFSLFVLLEIRLSTACYQCGHVLIPLVNRWSLRGVLGWGRGLQGAIHLSFGSVFPQMSCGLHHPRKVLVTMYS